MRTARIYRPAKTAMQSGRAKTRKWVLDFDPSAARGADPLMGWTSAGDTLPQVHLEFDTKEQAVAYAKAHGLPHQVFEPEEAKRVIKAYADNFAPNRKRPWTH